MTQRTLRDNLRTTNVDESMDVAATASANAVGAKDYVNTAPVFPNQAPEGADVDRDQTRNVAENSAPGTAVGDPVTATDIGADGNQEVLLYTLGGTDADSFDIDRSTGQLKTKADLDYEDSDNTDHEYEVTVTAADPSDTNSNQSRATITVTIEVTDVDEDPSINDGAATKITLTEITLAQTDTTITRDGVVDNTLLSPTDGAVILAPYAATDHDDDNDEDDDTKLTWSLSGADSEKFSISNEGTPRQLTFKGSLNFEDPTDSGGNNVYNVTVVVIDSDGQTDSLDVAVTVTNKEEDGGRNPVQPAAGG